MIRAYKYGLLEPVSGFDQSAVDVLFLRNKLWNRLVEIERESRQAYRELVLASDADLAAMQARLDEIEAERVEQIAQKRRLRASVRSKKVDTEAFDARVSALIAERTELRARAKAIRERVKEEVKPKAKELDQQRYAAVQKAGAESGLWWGNSETVIAAYDVARVKAMKEGADLKFRAFQGEGKYAVRQSGGLSLSELTSGQLSFVKLTPIEGLDLSHLSERGRRSKARHHLTMTVYTFTDGETGKKCRHQITWPIVMHREIPDGRIKTIHVHRKRQGDRFLWSCSISVDDGLEPPDMVDHASTASVGIDLGFRLTDAGLRVATLVDSKGMVCEFGVRPRGAVYPSGKNKSFSSRCVSPVT